jgi:hypothetical protein
MSSATTQRYLLGLLLTSIAGCGGDPRGFEYQTSRPKESEVIGRYELVSWQSIIPEATEATRDRSSNDALVLNEDGSFLATNVPGFEALSDGRIAPARLTSASGNWKLAVVAGLNDHEHVWGVEFTSEPRIQSADLMTRHRLVFVLGDPVQYYAVSTSTPSGPRYIECSYCATIAPSSSQSGG